MLRKIFILIVGSLFLLLFEVVPAKANLIGVEWSGEVVSINTSTGNISSVGNSGANAVNSLTQDSFGVLHAAGRISDIYSLLTIDPLTGSAAQVAALGFSGLGIDLDLFPVRSLAFSLDNTLYAAVNDQNDSYLTTIDVTSGTATMVGSLGGMFQGMDFSPSGSLYGWDSEKGLGTIDLTSGAFTDVSTTKGGEIPVLYEGTWYYLTMQSIVFDSQELLWGHSEAGLYNIDVTTGAYPIIGVEKTNEYSVRGIEVHSAPVPEPATMILLGLGLAGLAGASRKKLFKK